MNTCLDSGCGIGRHVLYLDDLDFDVYGIDISDKAINYAKKYFDKNKKSYLKDKLTVSSITNLPYQDLFLILLYLMAF